MIYPTFKATVRKGKIQLLEDVKLPEDAVLLVTLMDNAAFGTLSTGEHLIAGLQDIRQGNLLEINSPAELNQHLDELFQDE